MNKDQIIQNSYALVFSYLKCKLVEIFKQTKTKKNYLKNYYVHLCHPLETSEAAPLTNHLTQQHYGICDYNLQLVCIQSKMWHRFAGVAKNLSIKMSWFSKDKTNPSPQRIELIRN